MRHILPLKIGPIHSITFWPPRFGFRSRWVGFVLYLRRGISIEAWIGKRWFVHKPEATGQPKGEQLWGDMTD